MASKPELERRLRDPAPIAPAALGDLALDALDHGLFEAIVARVEQAVASGAGEGPSGARLYQVLGLAKREMLDGAGALAAFEQAAKRAPGDPLIAHGLARSAWDAGQPAVAHYDAALRNAPNDANLLTGRASALVSEGRSEEALAAMTRLLAENPGWHDGHATYAQLVSVSCAAVDGTATVRAAQKLYPGDDSLWHVLLRLLLAARRHDEAVEVARSASAQFEDNAEFRRVEAVALSELGEGEKAQRIFDRLPSDNPAMLIYPIRNLIRLGRIDEASSLAETPCEPSVETLFWPYRALLWRLSGDERWVWLEGDPRLIGIYDLPFSATQIEALAQVLRRLHRRSGEFGDQSVRGGTQTNGNLLAHADLPIRQLRIALLEAIAGHVANLPPAVAGHPTLIEQRAPVRFAGSWSVRLTGAGFHTDHVHPRGWLSSAFYVALPDTAGAAPGAGCLAFGEARDLLPDFEGFKLVEPKPGRLVLFPATMWHGTRPFPAGERMTVAFDVARPV